MRKFLLSAAVVGLLAASPLAAQTLTGWNLPRTTGTTRGIMPGVQATSSVAISVSTATTTKLVAALNAKATTWITGYQLWAGGTGNATLVYGTTTTTACDTGQTALTGIFNMTAQTHLEYGAGLGPILVPPPGNDICLVTSAAVQISGSLAYSQF